MFLIAHAIVVFFLSICIPFENEPVAVATVVFDPSLTRDTATLTGAVALRIFTLTLSGRPPRKLLGVNTT
jgi:hypothetical protein